MPKLRMNSIAGLRTVWSMKNETTWKKSQRFGGISFIVGGVIIIIVCFLTKGFSCFWWTMGIRPVTAEMTPSTTTPSTTPAAPDTDVTKPAAKDTTPAKTNNTASPKTGDAMPVAGMMLVLAGSLTGYVVIRRKRR